MIPFLSLIDVIELVSGTPMFLSELLCGNEQVLTEVIQQYGPLAQLPPDAWAHVRGPVLALREIANRFSLSGSGMVAQALLSTLNGARACNLQIVREKLADLRRTVIAEWGARQFAYIPPERSKYATAEPQFGAAVDTAFPDAQRDIRAAAESYAVGLNDACVYHLMRAAEIALRVLARDRGVKFPHPVELENWNTIIEKIDANVKDEVEKWPKSAAKSDALEFYRGATGEFRALKDYWRNRNSHARVHHNEHQAASAFLHTREFMARLAVRLSQSRKKPIAWRTKKNGP